MDVQSYLAECRDAVDALLEASVPPATEPPAPLHEAMRHLLLPGGKRLRPALCLAGCQAAGGARDRALPLAAAVELVHTFSLVHDDLPCMDDDGERRGRPTVHVAFGEDLAVLAGDALLALAFLVLAEAGALSAEERAASVAELAAAAGSRRLVGGQVDDLRADPAALDAERVEDVHARKSAALIAAAVVGGARLGGADAEGLASLRRFALDVGVAFQIADDLLDRGDAEPCSLVRVLGVAGARSRASALLERGLDEIAGLGEGAAPLRELARHAVWRDR